jgi:hypothetical protein
MIPIKVKVKMMDIIQTTKTKIFKDNGGATALSPVEGTVPQNKEGLLPEEKIPKTTEEYNALYDASKAVTTSPLTQK